MTLPTPVRVVGVGSSHGDDAVGWQVVSRLRKRAERLPGLEFHVIEGGHRLLEVLDGRGTLFLVDAIVTGGAAGTIYRLEWPTDRLEILRPGSTHSLGPAAAMKFAATLGLLPPQVVIFGIEVESLDPGDRLTEAVLAAVPVLVCQMDAELHR